MLKRLLTAFAFAAMAAYWNTHESGAFSIIAASNAAEAGYAPQVNNERGVKVTVTLKHILGGAKTWDFEAVLETHTQDLSDDLAKSAVLIADGKQYTPLGWEGAPAGGHHRKGVLRFKAITPQPAEAELQIRLSGDASPRSFKWLLR